METLSERQSYVIPIPRRTAPYEVVQIVNRPSSEFETDQHETRGTPTLFRLDSGLVNPTGVETTIYKEIALLSLAHTQLDWNQREETNDNHNEKLVIDNSGYVIPYTPPPDEEKIKSLPGYTKLDSTNREPDDNAQYQKLMKR